MRILYFLFSITFLFFIFISAHTQITRGSADGVDTTDYGDGSIPDSLFIFNVGNSDPYVEAISPDGTPRTFSWSLYDPLSGNYLSPVDVINVVSSRISITEQVGYKVEISGDSTYQFWAMINDFNITITSTDDEKHIRESDILCGTIDQIRAEIDSSSMYYYNPVSGTQIQYHADYTISINDWYPNPDPSNTHNIFQKLDNSNLIVAIEKPYWDDTWYVLEIEDEFGLVRKDSAFHESKQPHAAFTDPHDEYIYLDDSIIYPDRSERYYEIYDRTKYDAISAPAKFRFINESQNADQLTWIFGDDSTSKTQNDTIIHTYLLPGQYYPMLVVSTILPLSINPCVDTFPGSDDLVPEPIVVATPTVNAGADLGNWPNVFTPPNGEIKYFRFTGDVSITNFDISIYNRYGKRVYQYQGNVRDWEGWNGRIKGTGKYVSTGVYYYVIKEMYELPYYKPDPELPPPEGIDPEIKPQLLKGFVHVYNTE